jgi:hypothetical protein
VSVVLLVVFLDGIGFGIMGGDTTLRFGIDWVGMDGWMIFMDLMGWENRDERVGYRILI